MPSVERLNHQQSPKNKKPTEKDLKLAPNLPGFKLPEQITKPSFSKIHTLNYNNGYQTYIPLLKSTTSAAQSHKLGGKALVESEIKSLMKSVELTLQYGDRPLRYDKSPIKLASEPFMKKKANNSDAGEDDAKFTEYDGVVLIFNAFLREDIPDGVRGPALGVSDEHAREYTIRRCVIRYYMEDNTISIAEVPVLNSGLVAGPILKRQKVYKYAGTDDNGKWCKETISINEFTLGQEVVMYGKHYHLVSCDPFTENFARLHLNRSFTATNEELPTDPYVAARERVRKVLVEGKHNKDASDAWLKEKYRRFVTDYGKVLRFYCVWDDSESMYGELRPYEIHYYMVDDTVEVRTFVKSKTFDIKGLLVRRQMLPKKVNGIHDLAGTTPLGTNIDVKPPQPEDFYSWRDIKIGSTINVLERKFIIYDMDQYTRDHFKAHGWDAANLKPIDSPIERQRIAQKLAMESRAISEDNFLFKGQAPVRHVNIFKILHNEGKTLCFYATPITERADDKDRLFTITFRLAEEFINVFEPDGFGATGRGCKMAQRAAVINPKTKDYYKPSDFYVGAQITVYGRTYLLTEADEFAYNWMQSHPEQYPYGNLPNIKSKLEPHKVQIKEKLASISSGHILLDINQFAKLIIETSGNAVNLHETITFGRQYSSENSKKLVDIQKFLNEF